MSRQIHICVFGSSSPKTKETYIEAAFELGQVIASNNCVAVNGGGKFGVMGAVNRGCRSKNGTIVGVIHEKFVFDMDEDKAITKMVICKGNDLNERKQLLFDHADCIIVAPGGCGTLDEMWDAISCRSLKMKGLTHKPICLLNTDGFYDGSIQQLQRAYDDSLLYRPTDQYFKVVHTPEEAVAWCRAELERISLIAPHVSDKDERLKVRETPIVLDNGQRPVLEKSASLRANEEEGGGGGGGATRSVLLFATGVAIGAALPWLISKQR